MNITPPLFYHLNIPNNMNNYGKIQILNLT
jgi:hypothetical protein